MRKIYFDEDVDLAPLKGRLIGVIGYGNQGSAQARNLRDSGLDVIVGNRRDAYYQEAQRDGFPVFSIAQATSRADLVLVGIPDEIQQQVYERHMQKHIRGGQVLDFASSYGYRFKCIQPPPDVDVVMMSPRAMGVTVRELFLEGKGVPAFVAVGHDASGQARQIALALAKGVGCTRAGVLECTFQDEADVNLFGEQALWPLFNQALLLSYEVLVEAGVPPELVALEFYASGEAGEIFHKMAVEGMFEQTRYHSPTSQYGTLTRHEQLPAEEVKQRMKDTLRDIRNGRFAEEWAREQADGYPNLKRLRRQAFRHPLNRVEKNIRPLTPR